MKWVAFSYIHPVDLKMIRSKLWPFERGCVNNPQMVDNLWVVLKENRGLYVGLTSPQKYDSDDVRPSCGWATRRRAGG